MLIPTITKVTAPDLGWPVRTPGLLRIVAQALKTRSRKFGSDAPQPGLKPAPFTWL